MRISRPLMVSSLALLLVGAGCDRAAAPGADAPPANRPAANAPAAARGNGNVNAPAVGGDARILPAPTGIDDTWKTYTNTSLGFTFQTPTRGRYAPMWEVTFIDQDDASIVDGCYQDSAREDRTPERLLSSGFTFCRSFSREGAAGSVYLTQHVVTKRGPRIYIHLAFTKKAVNAGMLDCAVPPESGLSVSSEACVPFDMAAFDGQIETIISTFNLNEGASS